MTMNDHVSAARLAREVRFLKIYAIGSSLALLLLLLAAFGPARDRYDVLRAERLEILNPDGGHALVLAGQGRLPGPTFEGREYPQELSGGRVTASGMIFFNERGDEVGGLTFQGRLTDEAHAASGGLMFDQFRQDQVVGIQYQDNGAQRFAGVNVWDRATEISIAEVLDAVDFRARATGAARDSIEQVLQDMGDRGLSAQRISLGSENKTAALLMRDVSGRPRIRMYVDSTDVARLEFVDAEGSVTHTFPE
jgi:hypothetical protein